MAKATRSIKSTKSTNTPKRLLTNDNIQICGVKDLISGKELFDEELAKFDIKNRFSEKIIAENIATPPLLSEGHDIQVIWGTKDTEGKVTEKYRAVGGSMSADGTTVTIEGLKDVSKLRMSFKGILKIGKKPTATQPTPPPAATLSVKMGNINALNEWIIDFSNKEDGAGGSRIHLDALLEWLSDKADLSDDQSEVSVPGEDGVEKPLPASDFTIEFNKLVFNITRKTFAVDVSTPKAKAGETPTTLTIGNFTISDIGFIVTNEPDNYDDDEEEEIEDALVIN